MPIFKLKSDEIVNATNSKAYNVREEAKISFILFEFWNTFVPIADPQTRPP